MLDIAYISETWLPESKDCDSFRVDGLLNFLIASLVEATVGATVEHFELQPLLPHHDYNSRQHCIIKS